MTEASPQSENHLLTQVVNGGYCIGCGSCASVKASPYQMQLDSNGFFRPQALPNLVPSTDVPFLNAQSVCPFSDNSNEDHIGKELFQSTCHHDSKVGYFFNTYAGYVAEGQFRKNGSSGGMGTWIATELLKRNLVDAIIHVKEANPSQDNRKLFQYEISETPESLSGGAKSKYYPVELSEVFQKVRNKPGRYALIGLPCFIKSARLLAAKDPVVKERLNFFIGLVCGHLKSSLFADYIGWLAGIKPGNLGRIDFRHKDSSKPASEYSVSVNDTSSKDQKILSVKDIFGYDWGKNLFKYPACDFCDDVYAETADVVIGDAWLKQYVNNPEGTNIIVTRSPLIDRILMDALAEKRIVLDPLSIEDVIRSQAGGLRHRRDGLAYRLYLKTQENKWHPKKRVAPNPKAADHQYRKIFSLRQTLREKSFIFYHEALEKNNLTLFIQKMNQLFAKYDQLYTRKGILVWLRARLGQLLRRSPKRISS